MWGRFSGLYSGGNGSPATERRSAVGWSSSSYTDQLREFSGQIRDKYVKNVLILRDFVANSLKRRLFFDETVSYLLWIIVWKADIAKIYICLLLVLCGPQKSENEKKIKP